MVPIFVGIPRLQFLVNLVKQISAFVVLAAFKSLLYECKDVLSLDAFLD